MKIKTQRYGPNAGFTLIEMMVAIGLLTLIMAIVFSNIDMVQKRYNIEDAKTDSIQESREFLDQITRDLSTAGFPNGTMYKNTNIPADIATSKAVGLVAISATDIIFEGDLDGDGSANVIEYQLDNTANSGNCPCAIKRSVVAKDGSTATLSLTPTFDTEVQRVVNSTGNGNSPYTISGKDSKGNTFDTVYVNFKYNPVFEYYDITGTKITGVPNDLSTSGSPSNQTTGSAFSLLARVRTVVVTINVVSTIPDQQTQQYPAFSLRGVALILNPKI